MTKKKKRCYAWIFAVLFAAVCGIPTVCWLFSPAIDTSDFSPQTNRNLAQMGDVRLLYDGLHLYKTNVNCGFAKSRKSIDGRPTFDMYASVFSDMEGEYVTEQYILYFQRVDNGITYDLCLYIQDRESGKKVLIATNVSDFLQINEQNIYYTICRPYDSGNPNNDTLWRYNIETEQSECILQDITAFCIQENVLYSVSCATSRFAIDIREHSNIIRAYDLVTMNSVLETEVLLDFVVTKIMAQNDHLILWSNKNRLYLHDTTKDVGEYLWSEGPLFSEQANIHINCSNKYLYISMRITELTKMDSLTGVVLTGTGTWRYNLKSKEWLHLSSDVYDALYIFDENYVFGVIGNEIYQIATDGSKNNNNTGDVK